MNWFKSWWNACEFTMTPKVNLCSNCTKHHICLFCVIKVFKICIWSASIHPNHLVALVVLPKLWMVNEHSLGFQIFNTQQLEENQLYHLIFLRVCHSTKVLKHLEVIAIAINNFELKIKWKSSHCKVMWGNPKVFDFDKWKWACVFKFWNFGLDQIILSMYSNLRNCWTLKCGIVCNMSMFKSKLSYLWSCHDCGCYGLHKQNVNYERHFWWLDLNSNKKE